MGIASLRRYHQKVDAAKAPKLDPGTVSVDDKDKLAEANAAKVGTEQAVQAKLAKADKAESVHPVIRGDVDETAAERPHDEDGLVTEAASESDADAKTEAPAEVKDEATTTTRKPAAKAK